MQIQRVEQEQRQRGDLPFILLKPSFFNLMFDSLLKSYGSAGISMIFAMGRERGIGEVREYRKEFSQFSMSLSKRELLNRVFLRLNQMGWGKYDIGDYNPDSNIFTIDMKFNPLVVKCGSNSNGSCAFIQGLLSGVVSEVFEKEVSMASPRCEKSPSGSCSLHFTSIVG